LQILLLKASSIKSPIILGIEFIMVCFNFNAKLKLKHKKQVAEEIGMIGLFAEFQSKG